MKVTVRIPAPLRRFTDNHPAVIVSADTVKGALKEVDSQYQDLAAHLYGDEGKLRNFVNVYVRGVDIRYLEGMETRLEENDEVMIIPSIAGGKENNSVFEQDDYIRYSRHFSLPEIGLEGQHKLKDSSVLIIGVGGLGSPISIYLAAAGVGHIGLVDFDVVDLSNLHRQILYSSQDVNQPKLKIAKERLESISPKTKVTTFEEPLTSSNAMRILRTTILSLMVRIISQLAIWLTMYVFSRGNRIYMVPFSVSTVRFLSFMPRKARVIVACIPNHLRQVWCHHVPKEVCLAYYPVSWAACRQQKPSSGLLVQDISYWSIAPI